MTYKKVTITDVHEDDAFFGDALVGDTIFFEPAVVWGDGDGAVRGYSCGYALWGHAIVYFHAIKYTECEEEKDND